MAAFNYQQNQYGIRDTGSVVTVPNSHRARLMYYFNSICTVLPGLDDSQELRRLRNFRSHWSLSNEEELVLLRLCNLLDPDDLTGTCMYKVNGKIDGYDNTFWELSQETTRLTGIIAGRSVMVAGKSRRVTKILLYNQTWVSNNYYTPYNGLMDEIRERMRRDEEARQSQACTIL